MDNTEENCPVCGMPMDDNHYEPVPCPYLPENICRNCEENLGLMFTNFEKKPGDTGDGYIEPDHSDRLARLTGRTYLENRLLYYRECLESLAADAETATELEAEIKQIHQAILKGRR